MSAAPSEPTASAPGKILLAGEYAVLDGAPAIVTAVNRRAVARLAPGPVSQSPFLEAVRARIAERCGADCVAALAAARVVADSSAFRDGNRKLGLGSSAAVTVAAAATALASGKQPVRREDVHAIAHLAHGDGQEPRGSRGSGADVAASVYGGTIAAIQGDPTGQRPLRVRPVALPAGVTLIPVWSGKSASTGPLVAAVRAFRDRDSATYERILEPVSDLADSLATSADDNAANSLAVAPFVRRIALAGRAIAELGKAAGVELWIDAHSRADDVARAAGGASKPTGAGGGDLVLLAVPSENAGEARRELARLALPALDLALESEGVRIESPAPERIHG